MATLELTMIHKPKPWGTNDDRKTNPYVRYQIIEQWKAAAKLTFQQWRLKSRVPVPFPFTVVQVVIAFPTRIADGRRDPMVGRRDPHNYCGTVVKAVIDGLVLASVWPKDTPDYVGHRESLLIASDDPPRIRLWCSPGSEPWET